MEASVIFSTSDLKRWKNGLFRDAYKWLGAHPDGGNGTLFRVWAPNAKEVSVVGTFNEWNSGTDPMEKDEATGIWTGAVESARTGDLYKYRILTASNETLMKADPFAFYSELRPKTASIICNLDEFEWNDSNWPEKRRELQRKDRPLSIYEVHLGSWKRKPERDPGYMSYTELAKELIPYVKEMEFTHIELMPVAEHPYDPSWGYQGTGFYAPTSRFGRPQEFMHCINRFHEAGIGVLLDWVPGHFPDDEHGLSTFDGTPLYEHADPRRSRQQDWETNNFDYEKPGVRNFLISNACYWADKYHIDGIRVDGVASMLYLDYSKDRGKWLPNVYGGKENLGAVAFLQDLNTTMQERFPSLTMIAEESTSWPGVTKPVKESGLGFDFKWNLGWMHDTLQFFEKKPKKRGDASHQITFPVTYAFNENFILPFSHDEVVHLKKSLWGKMPGNSAEKSEQLKLLLFYWITYPGKKLLFMGSEFGQHREWSESEPLEWELLEEERNRDIKAFTADLLRFYKKTGALYETDCDADGFEWLDLSGKESGWYVYIRRDVRNRNKLAIVCNFSGRKVKWNAEIVQKEGEFAPLFDTREGRINNSQMNILGELPPYYGIILDISGNEKLS